jgi:hypothetical protein
MAKIVNCGSGPIPLDPNDSPRPIVGRKEVVVTPNPNTKAQRQANTKARRLAAAEARQEQNAHAPAKLSKGQKKARRKHKRELYYKAEQPEMGQG